MLDIIIPIQTESVLLDECVASIEKYTTDYRLHVYKDASINVSEARQAAMDTLELGRYICFLDDDSRLVHSGWDTALIDATTKDDKIVISYAEEDWGEFGVLQKYRGVQHAKYGPAACMLIDTAKLPIGHRWCKYIGLNTGWLGGDFEEVEYVYRLKHHDLVAVGTDKARFLHVDRPSIEDFRLTDRAMTCRIMKALIELADSPAGYNTDFFRKLHYVKADPNNDRMLANGQTLKDAFYDVLIDNNLSHFPMFKRWGLT